MLLRAGPADVQPVPTSAYPAAARRPANSRLDTSLFRRSFGLRLPPWQDGVHEVLRHLLRRDIDA
jgi:dTDP-4-dehydrorhamnose reductase